MRENRYARESNPGTCTFEAASFTEAAFRPGDFEDWGVTTRAPS
ncbi:hypothetical protein [Natrinema gelatinilyticum]|nr:hypothetical protein [Natrinema gelatinilyticum]